MVRLELMADESVVWEGPTQHIQRWWYLPARVLILTDRRLILSTSGFDPAADDLGNVFTSLLGRAPNGKVVWETRLEELSVMSRVKFGLNNRVLRFETRSGDVQRVIVDKVDVWIDAFYEAVNATGVVEIAETESDRWVVK